jgi:hypothetical protein
MPWVKIDDKFHSHPKVIAAGVEGVALHVIALSWCGEYLTDGFIPEAQIRRLSLSDNYQAIAAHLVSVGLWDIADGGYQIHDYLEYNPSAEQVRAQRAANAERQARHRDKQEPPDEPEPSSGNDVTNGVTNGVTNASPVPVPVPNPVPVPEEKAPSAAQAPPTPPPKRTQSRSKTLTPEAVRVFRANAHRYPAKSWYDDVARIVGTAQDDLTRWGSVVKAWVGMGWKPTNVRGMLDCYERGEIPGQQARKSRPTVDYTVHTSDALPEREESEAQREWYRIQDALQGIMTSATFDHVFQNADPQFNDGHLVVVLAGDAQRAGFKRVSQHVGRCLDSAGLSVEFR